MLVDAGYLLGAAGTLLGSVDRSALEIDHPKLLIALIEEAQSQTGMPVLRLLWYDGAPNSRPTPKHRSFRLRPGVEVRLRELVERNGRVQQKGVGQLPAARPHRAGPQPRRGRRRARLRW